MWQRRSQLLLRHHSEAVDAGMDEKAFEARHTCGGKRFDIGLIIMYDSAPGRPVDAATALSRGALGFQSGDCRRWRQAVQWHVYQECIAAGGSGAGRRLQTLPLS